MERLHIFADESGDFEFSKRPNVSRYFIICTAAMRSCTVGDELIALRRRLAWEGYPLGSYFHATEDKQAVRNEVFGLIGQHKFSIQATIMEKSKAYGRVRTSEDRFYQYGWFYHFTHGIQQTLQGRSEVLITAASIGTKRKQGAFRNAVNDVVQQTVRGLKWATTFCPSAADPCLQVADYCTWAIRRKWENGESQSYDLIKDRVTYEYDLWGHGRKHHY